MRTKRRKHRPGESGPAPARKRTLGSLPKKLLLCGMTILLILLVAEAATRLFTATAPPLFENHPVLGQTFVPGLAASHYVEESRREVFLRINREGLRDEDRPYRKPPGVRRIAVLGDSMTAAMAADEERTFVRVLERLLERSQSGTKWEVMNCGVSGSGPGQELVLYREVVARYEPDIVLFAFYVGNDLGDSSRELTSSRHRIYFRLDAAGNLVQVPNSYTRSKLSLWLNRHSRFYVWNKLRVNQLKSRLEIAMAVMSTGKIIYREKPSDEVTRAWRILEKLIETMQHEVKADGARFAVVVLPTAEQILDERWEELLELAGPIRDDMNPDHPERRLTAMGERIGVPVLTLVDEFRRAAPHRSLAYEDEWLHYNGDGHFNEAGHQLAAELIHRFLTESEAGVAMVEDSSRDPVRAKDGGSLPPATASR